MAKGFTCTSDSPVVETKAGKLRGFELDDTYHFYGIPYGKAKRWEQPEPADCWEGVKDALAFGYICPPFNPDSPNGDILIPHRWWPKSEDCLNLNIWTPSIDRNAKKPVMVWLHGGLFADGSSVEMVAYDGENLAHDGDLVFVSLNHRMGPYGFLNVSRFGEKYKNSQNCGLADMVLALQWIHDNIEAFGGDPGNVTIFGQSGGGQKVSSLMQIKAAEGLFHKAIIQSGSGGRPTTIRFADSSDCTEAMLKELGSDSIDALLALSTDELMALARKCAPRHAFSFGPLENEWFDHIIFDGSTENAKKIPLLIGTNIAEMNSMMFNIKNRESMTKEEKEAIVLEKFGEELGTKLLKQFYEAYPDHDAIDALTLDDGCRTTTQWLCDQRAADGSAPTYNYMFSYNFPIDGGRATWHCAEIPFVFRHIDKVPVCNEPEIGERLQEQFSRAWISFVHTGDPNTDLLPEWRPYTKGDEFCMIIDRKCEGKVDFDRELLKTHAEGKINFMRPDMRM